MYDDGESIFYYLTLMNENYEMPPMPPGSADGILKGMYRVKASENTQAKLHAQIFGSGAILNEALKAQRILGEKYGVAADVWSVTSYKQLYRDGQDTERWNRQMWVVRLFDQLIYNTDRNLGNLLIDKDWRLWMIDHTRGFKMFSEPKSPKNLAPQCARGLLEALRRLDQATLAAATRDLLGPGQVKGLLARRDFIVKYYDERIRELGEDAVLYDLPSRVD